MKVFLNDEEKILDGSSFNITVFLSEVGFGSTNGIALAVNEEIIPKTSWEAYTLNENDRVLIITATQGG